MLALFRCQLLKDSPAAGILRQARGSGIELIAAFLGRNRDAQCITREHELGRSPVHRPRLRPPGARPAFFTHAENLDDGLLGCKTAGSGYFFHEGLDIRAQELGRTMAGIADQMEMAGMAIRVLETRSALAKVDLTRDTRLDHPLKCAVDSCPSNS